jgi:hypothetical protein
MRNVTVNISFVLVSGILFGGHPRRILLLIAQGRLTYITSCFAPPAMSCHSRRDLPARIE